jgi:hypothetical protein
VSQSPSSEIDRNLFALVGTVAEQSIEWLAAEHPIAVVAACIALEWTTFVDGSYNREFLPVLLVVLLPRFGIVRIAHGRCIRP